jgi:hypothetical protein
MVVFFVRIAIILLKYFKNHNCDSWVRKNFSAEMKIRQMDSYTQSYQTQFSQFYKYL